LIVQNREIFLLFYLPENQCSRGVEGISWCSSRAWQRYFREQANLEDPIVYRRSVRSWTCQKTGQNDGLFFFRDWRKRAFSGILFYRKGGRQYVSEIYTRTTEKHGYGDKRQCHFSDAGPSG